jgi:hypothetical protein
VYLFRYAESAPTKKELERLLKDIQTNNPYLMVDLTTENEIERERIKKYNADKLRFDEVNKKIKITIDEAQVLLDNTKNKMNFILDWLGYTKKTGDAQRAAAFGNLYEACGILLKAKQELKAKPKARIGQLINYNLIASYLIYSAFSTN